MATASGEGHAPPAVPAPPETGVPGGAPGVAQDAASAPPGPQDSTLADAPPVTGGEPIHGFEGSALNEFIAVECTGDGEYLISVAQEDGQAVGVPIQFHVGALTDDAGTSGFPNGLSMEALLAVVVHRLGVHQNGPYANRETALARTKVEEGLLWLLARTTRRIWEGVEGQREKD